jgi:hypothetical protein
MPPDADPAAFALSELLRGPNQAERVGGVPTAALLRTTATDEGRPGAGHQAARRSAAAWSRRGARREIDRAMVSPTHTMWMPMPMS